MKMKNQARVRFLLPVLTLVCCLFAGTASAQSVPVTLRVSDAPLEQVLSAIEKQTTYLFVYDKNVDVARRVSIDVKDTPLNNVLNTLFQSSDIAYAVENTSIVLSQKAPAAQPGQPVTVTGKVVDASGMPVIGAAVIIKGTTIGTSTGVDGDFFNLCGIFGYSFFIDAILLFAHERFTAQFQENPFVLVIHNQIRSFN